MPVQAPCRLQGHLPAVRAYRPWCLRLPEAAKVRGRLRSRREKAATCSEEGDFIQVFTAASGDDQWRAAIWPEKPIRSLTICMSRPTASTCWRPRGAAPPEVPSRLSQRRAYGA